MPKLPKEPLCSCKYYPDGSPCYCTLDPDERLDMEYAVLVDAVGADDAAGDFYSDATINRRLRITGLASGHK